ncbi:acetyl-CoA synthetase-like protein [Athelia psychrophila]|uniref:Acetyl-CoA synthetase-like protein n=1 Tax=Athelia psychrophila TaxID=1759441 RepID=A0A166K4H8_9AGAM|nr:acetyl-CoA synthetase-like protein [Fibularhizoctonia sp. CBS 109695]
MSTQLSTVYPPMDGTVRPAALVDFHLEYNPTHKAYVYSEAPGSLVEISFLEFGRAVHRAGHLLRPKRSGPENEVVAVIANVDVLLYQTLVAGMMRAGLVPFPIAPRNSAEAVVSMLQKSGCRRIVTTSATLGPLISQIKALTPADSSLTFEDVPTVSQCYPHLGQEMPSHPFTPYPAPQTPLDLDQPLFYLHSSGSTGFPKPIPQTSRTILGWLGGMHLPPFHTLGTVLQLFAPLFAVNTIAVYPPTSLTDHNTPPAAPTTDSAMEHSKRTGVTALIAVPSFLETWSLDAEAMEWMKSLDFIGYGGGPLARKVGDALAADGVPITCVYGATEFGCPTTLFAGAEDRGPEDWSYMRFDEKAHVRWVRQADGTFESHFLETEVHKLSVLNLPDARGYASNDLWEPHPTKANFWRIVGRLDDVIILASGENMVPGPLETIIMSSPVVNGVVIFGRERNQLLAKSGLHATSFRIGQISGGRPSGAWATSDWVPSFVKSSLALGALPDAQGVASWLPMDVVAQAVLDVALSEQPPSIALNIVHPRPSQWSTVITSVANALHRAGVADHHLPLVPFKEWFARLEQRSKGADADEMAKIPAIKLLEFFRGMSAADEAMRTSGRTDREGGMASLSTSKSQAASKSMAEVQPVGVEDAQRWVDYWTSKGFFD